MAAPLALKADQARVRMYRVGFGDCFLVSVPGESGHRHVLVDFGVHPKGDVGTLEAALDDIARLTERKLAVVVASHEHADHISGFGKFSARFGHFQVGEVWMPWAMDPADPLARSLQARQLALAEALHARFRALPAALSARASAARDAVLNLRGNDKAVQALRSGFGGSARRVRYLESGEKLSEPAGLRGVGVEVLGPTRDKEFLKRLEPPAAERYLRAKTAGAGGAADVKPFAAKWVWPAAKARRVLGLSAALEKELTAGLDEELDWLAFTLDSIRNNTSLVLLLRVGARTLLFPGDAQWGSWKYWLEKADAASRLKQLSFLKVAHHGSHNATPRSALDRMGAGAFAAMVSTQNEPWQSIPQGRLMSALEKQTHRRVARSDLVPVRGAPAAPKGSASQAKGFSIGRGEAEPWVDFVTKV